MWCVATDLLSEFLSNLFGEVSETVHAHMAQTIVYIYGLALELSQLSCFLSECSPERSGPSGQSTEYHIGPLYQ